MDLGKMSVDEINQWCIAANSVDSLTVRMMIAIDELARRLAEAEARAEAAEKFLDELSGDLDQRTSLRINEFLAAAAKEAPRD